MGVTIKDIAKLANVSATTVSNVINGKTAKTTEETKEKILQLVREMDYKPNAMARSLVNGKSKLIGLIVPDISDPYFSYMTRAIEDVGRGYGYRVLSCSTYNNVKNEHMIIDELREHCVDGMIVSSSLIKENWQFNDILKIKYPLVSIGRSIESGEDVCSVCVDNFKSGYEATKYLINLGHRNIACIAGDEWLQDTRDRISGFKKALEDNKIEISDERIYCGTNNVETGIKGMNEIFSVDKDVTAVVACSDMIAYGVYKSARVHSMTIPKDLSVVGIGDLSFSKIVTPELTTVQEPVEEIAETAVKMLISIINKKPHEKNEYKYDSRLVIRESTGSKKN